MAFFSSVSFIKFQILLQVSNFELCDILCVGRRLLKVLLVQMEIFLKTEEIRCRGGGKNLPKEDRSS